MNLLEILLTLVGMSEEEQKQFLNDSVEPALHHHILSCYNAAGQFVDAMDRKVIHVCCYIPASEFFTNFPEVWEELSNSDPNFTWGDNNRSLVTVERIVQHLDASHIDYPEAFEEHYKEYVPEDYIDLEN